ncbi:calcium-binding protein [Jannaschia marina]|uniref:calcium-binding protein n=1 Tax=Jannaschia marina TaxID=2741674 RepID=UPI001F258713|nr:calcium-binding protein [Jannaschia marina]
MLLIAGLAGLFVSGVMMALPLTEAADGDDASPDVDRGEEAGAATDDETERMDIGDLLDGVQPQPPLPPELPEEEPGLAPRDQIGGDHLTDRIAGSFDTPVDLAGDAMLGNAGDDDLVGGDLNDMLVGNDGDDNLSGGAGRDVLDGGADDDLLDGGDDRDQLIGDTGDDTLHGGAGDDLLSGGDGDDRLIGGSGDDRLFGGEGADTLEGGAGDDLLDGSVLRADGTDRDDGDLLSGDAGDDTIAGGPGDSLSGGEGHDLFLFRAASAAAFTTDGGAADVPIITDFEPASDAIEIEYDGATAPVVEIVATDGETRILLEGEIAVRVSGTPGIEARHISLLQIG